MARCASMVKKKNMKMSYWIWLTRFWPLEMQWLMSKLTGNRVFLKWKSLISSKYLLVIGLSARMNATLPIKLTKSGIRNGLRR